MKTKHKAFLYECSIEDWQSIALAYFAELRKLGGISEAKCKVVAKEGGLITLHFFILNGRVRCNAWHTRACKKWLGCALLSRE